MTVVQPQSEGHKHQHHADVDKLYQIVDHFAARRISASPAATSRDDSRSSQSRHSLVAVATRRVKHSTHISISLGSGRVIVTPVGSVHVPMHVHMHARLARARGVLQPRRETSGEPLRQIGEDARVVWRVGRAD